MRTAVRRSRKIGAASSPTPVPEHPVGAWLLAAPTPKTVGQGYFRLIDTNATIAVPRVLDYLATVPDVDPERIGIVGFSTNGFIALQAAAADPRIGAAAALFACGDYHRFLHLSTLGMKGAPLDLAADYDRWLHAREPIRHPERLLHAALLTVNGREDPTIPFACAEESIRAFREAYTRAGLGERYRAVVIEGTGHDLAAMAREETIAWLARWLGRSADASHRPHAMDPHASRD